jgi:predicted  nucleic acid-binding Zn-ribbon protein
MKNQEKPVTPNFGEIGTIRDILMGQHINDFENRFSDIANRVQQLEQDLRKAMQEQEDRTNQRFSRLNEEMNERFARLQKNLDDNTKMLDEKVNRTSKADKAIVGAMLMEVGKQLMGNDTDK